jgi:hypothetical protein
MSSPSWESPCSPRRYLQGTPNRCLYFNQHTITPDARLKMKLWQRTNTIGTSGCQHTLYVRSKLLNARIVLGGL